MTKRVVIVGGGISGLAAAHALTSQHPDLEVSLCESSDRLGGNIYTDTVEDFVVEHGPDSFVVSKPHALALCRKLGLEDQLISTPAENRAIYFVRNGELQPLPDGLVLGVPTRLLPLLQTPLLSLGAKLRAALEPFIPVRQGSADESVHAFFSRRLGQAVADLIAGPLIGGIYAGDPRALSINATFPQFRELERRYGSLILGLIASRSATPIRPPRNLFSRIVLLVGQLLGSKRRGDPAFLSLKGGMKTLIDALERALPQGTIRRKAAVSNVALIEDQSENPVRVTLTSGEQISAQAALVAAPVQHSARLLDDPELTAELGAIRTVSTATVVLAFARDAVAHPLQGLGFVVPKGEGQILAATWISSKWPHRAPGGKVLMRAFLGGPNHEHQVDLTDSALVDLALTELRRLMGRLDAPLFSRVYRYRQASPQPELGHPERVARIHARLRAFPGLYLSAGGLDGIGIPDTIKHAEQAADRIATQLK